MTAPTLTPLAPQEAIAFFEPKGLRAGYAWQDVWHEEHAASFTVAKMMQTDLLATVQQSLADALKSGQTYEDWAKSITPTLQDAGWWGRSVMTDPLTGQDKAVQLGSPRRLRIIYDTNMRMSRAVGHWDRIQERKKERPYLRYVAVMDAQTRPDHARWHGIIRRVDDEFWKTHYPPCGWRCRCTVIQLSAADLERRGWKVTDDDALKAAGYGQTFQYVNPRTGEVIDVPAGIDPGFGYNVGIAGREASAVRQLLDKITPLPAPIGAALVDPRKLGKALAHGFQTWLATIDPYKPRGESRAIGVLSPRVVARLTQILGQPPESAAIFAYDTAISHAVRGTHSNPTNPAKDILLPPDILKRLPEIIANPKGVLWDSGPDGILVFIYDVPAALLKPGQKTLAKLVVRVNFSTKDRSPLGKRAVVTTNAMASAFLTADDAFKDATRWILLDGKRL